MAPAMAPLVIPPTACTVPTAPWAAPMWRVPRVRSAITTGKSAPISPAPTPSSNCTPTSQTGWSNRV